MKNIDKIPMTHIVSPNMYPSKKALREAINKNPDGVFLSDPSIINPISGSVTDILKERKSITVTNHPKRSWFAEIKISQRGKNKGRIIVK